MQAVKKMGSIGKLMGMLRARADARKQLESPTNVKSIRVTAIIRSMTRGTAQFEHPQRFPAARVAKGSGVHVSEVNNLLERSVRPRR